MLPIVEDTSLRSRLAHGLAALGDRVATTELSDEQLESLCDAVTELAAGAVGVRRAPWWEQGPDFGAAYRKRSPFIGAENPRSFGMSILDTSTVERSGAQGNVTLSHLFAGPPGAVHGGVLAGLFDEVLGSLARHMDPDGIVVTATLSTRFRKPTPVETPLVIDAWISRRGARRMRAEATCVADGVVTATAEALMVLRRPKKMDQA